MPAAICHTLLAQRLMETPYGKRQCLMRDAFLWGAQGPDFLFSHRFFPWQKGESLASYGEKLHQLKPAVTLEYMRGYLREQSADEATRSYILGFLTHYAFDSIAHPFIQYGAEMLHQQIEPSTLETCHNEIEAVLDIILLRYETAQLPTDFPLKKAVPKNEQVYAAMVKLYEELFIKLFHRGHCGRQLRQAILDCRTAFGWMTDRTSLKKTAGTAHRTPPACSANYFQPCAPHDGAG